MQRLTSFLSRVLFVLAFVPAVIGIWERLAQLAGYTIVRGYYTSGRLFEYSAVALLFVMALQLREIKLLLRDKGAN